MVKVQQEVELGFKIVKIYTSKFNFSDLDEEDIDGLLTTTEALAINMKFVLKIDRSTSLIDLDVSTELINRETENVLVEHIGRTSFLISGLEQTYDESKDIFNLPEGLLVQLHSIAYTHARALLATELSPTPYKHKYFLPVIYPDDLLKYINNRTVREHQL